MGWGNKKLKTQKMRREGKKKTRYKRRRGTKENTLKNRREEGK